MIGGIILSLISFFTSPIGAVAFSQGYVPTIWNMVGIYSGVILFFAGISLLGLARANERPST